MPKHLPFLSPNPSRAPTPSNRTKNQPRIDEAASRRIRNYTPQLPTTASKTNAAAGNTAAAGNVEDPLFFLEVEELDEDTKNVMRMHVSPMGPLRKRLVKVMLLAFDNLETYPDFLRLRRWRY